MSNVTEPMTWFRLYKAGADRDDPETAVMDICHYCAIVCADTDMEVELVEMENVLDPDEDFKCENCDRVIASG